MKRPFGMIYKCREMNFELRVQWFFLFRCQCTTQYSYASRMMLNTMERCSLLDFDDTSSSNLSFEVIGDDFNCARLKSQVSFFYIGKSEERRWRNFHGILFYFHNLSHFPWSDFGNVARDVFYVGGKVKKTEDEEKILHNFLVLYWSLRILKQLPHHYVHLVRGWWIKIYDKSIFLMSPQMMVTMFLMCILEGGRKRMSNIIFPVGGTHRRTKIKEKKTALKIEFLIA